MKSSRFNVPWWLFAAWAILLGSLASTLVVMLKTRADPFAATAKHGVRDAVVLENKEVAPNLPPGEDPEPAEGAHGELFTPAGLIYNTFADRFEAPEGRASGGAPAAGTVRLELVSLTLEACPVRLIGHVGSGASLRGIFELAEGEETLVAKSGHVFAGLGLTVESLRVPRAQPGTGEARREAVAVLRDGLSGERIELRPGERRWSGPPTARIRIVADDRMVEVREGDRFEAGSGLYRVAALETTPAVVEIVGETPGAPSVEWLPKRGTDGR